MPTQTVGLALSGGGARGLTHVGVLQALDELGIKASHISGTSAGALIGGMYAAGISPMDILRIVQEQKFLTPGNFSVRRNGIFSINPLVQMLEKNLPIRRFEELPLRFYATATNIEDGNTVTFDSGDMVMPMVASSAVPLMFAPVMLDGKPYLDGGVINNFPVEPVQDCNLVIGSNVSNWPEAHKKWNRVLIVQRCFHLSMSTYLNYKKEKCHIFIDPPVGHYSGFNKKNLKQLVDLGYEYTMQRSADLLNLYNS